MSKERVKKCCNTCELNTGSVCMGCGKRTDNDENTYGMPINEAIEMFPDGCNDWELSFDVFHNLY